MILAILIILISYKDRVAAAAGVEHVKIFRFGKGWNPFGSNTTHVVRARALILDCFLDYLDNVRI